MVDIAPRFFDKQSRLRSFHRQLSIWVGYNIIFNRLVVIPFVKLQQPLTSPSFHSLAYISDRR